MAQTVEDYLASLFGGCNEVFSGSGDGEYNVGDSLFHDGETTGFTVHGICSIMHTYSKL